MQGREGWLSSKQIGSFGTRLQAIEALGGCVSSAYSHGPDAPPTRFYSGQKLRYSIRLCADDDEDEG